MPQINELISAIADLIASEEKSYNIPSVCTRYGLDAGDESEAFSSKRSYVIKRLSSKKTEYVLKIAEHLLHDYNSPVFAKVAEKFLNKNFFKVSIITRRNIIDELIIKGNIEGNLELPDFLNRIWELDKLPSTDFRYNNAYSDIYQHMVNNNDWDYTYLFFNYFDILYISDEQFFDFIEQVVHPIVRSKDTQLEYVQTINKYLFSDGYELEIYNYISEIPIYKVFNISKGVSGNIKNLIFSADGPKPEIVLLDSLNNDISITKNAQYCLVYDQPIPVTGLLWKDLVNWWTSNSADNIDAERELYKRLFKSLDSPPEELFFNTFYKEFHKNNNSNFPALIPQVYLHYDPYTINKRGEKLFTHQRMDFLFLFSNKSRVVIEIDGKQHYSKDDKASPELYSNMVSADRKLKLAGYDVYRFGGYELRQDNAKDIILDFFYSLFDLYKVNYNKS
jgi:hypothetical protein